MVHDFFAVKFWISVVLLPATAESLSLRLKILSFSNHSNYHSSVKFKVITPCEIFHLPASHFHSFIYYPGRGSMDAVQFSSRAERAERLAAEQRTRTVYQAITVAKGNNPF